MSLSSSDTNAIFLTGFIEAAPTHRQLPSGLPVANAKLVSVSKFLSTEKTRAVNRINLAFYGPAADIARTLKDNDHVYLEGELVIRSTSTTSDRTTTEVVVRQLRQVFQNTSAAASVADWG